MFKRLILAAALVVGGLGLQASAASAAPARSAVELAEGVKSSVQYAQYYHGPRRRYAAPRHYGPQRYYGRGHYRGRYAAPRRYYPGRPAYARPVYPRRVYYR
ncbi:hypothetical protein [Microvirga antarctica]|uniref:hypothetical protein n=1 Tax=Microvirga antarctica TaxID=2819233 RepID=UPI001B30F322|nr:hypothetical protein [Microvirga antarctica]